MQPRRQHARARPSVGRKSTVSLASGLRLCEQGPRLPVSRLRLHSSLPRSPRPSCSLSTPAQAALAAPRARRHQLAPGVAGQGDHQFINEEQLWREPPASSLCLQASLATVCVLLLDYEPPPLFGASRGGYDGKVCAPRFSSFCNQTAECQRKKRETPTGVGRGHHSKLTSYAHTQQQ